MQPAHLREPAEPRRRRPGRTIFGPMPSAITRRPESGERRGEVERSGAWLVPPRRIGKLDMRRDMAVSRPCESDVVAITSEMIEVEKQRSEERRVGKEGGRTGRD